MFSLLLKLPQMTQSETVSETKLLTKAILSLVLYNLTVN